VHPDLSNYPQWINWVAQDESGAWWGYSAEPLQQHNGWYENEVGQHIKLSMDKTNPQWKSTLQKIQR
jgi:hypothetical protein